VVDGRADQYALAGSAFHLLTGSPPFAHFNPAVTVSKHLNDRPPRPSDVRPDLTDYDAIFVRALSQDPVDRFRRCRDFAKALESTAGSRSHIRGAAIFRDAPDRQDTATTAMLAAPESDNAAPTKPAAHAAPDTARHDAPAAPDVLPDSDVDEATPSVEPVVSGAVRDDAADDEARRRRLQHNAALAGVILVVVLACFFGVKALRSASQSDDTPTGVDTTSAESTTPPPATTAPPAMIAPPPPPPAPPAPSHPVVTAVTTPPTITPSPAVTTRPPTSSSTPQTTVSQTTTPRSTSPTTTPSGLDTRPAVGMPCSPDQTGAAATSNSGGPVSCVDTPGGSAWEPPGG
jgi:serine/threonine-protein kinase